MWLVYQAIIRPSGNSSPGYQLKRALFRGWVGGLSTGDLKNPNPEILANSLPLPGRRDCENSYSDFWSLGGPANRQQESKDPSIPERLLHEKGWTVPAPRCCFETATGPSRVGLCSDVFARLEYRRCSFSVLVPVYDRICRANCGRRSVDVESSQVHSLGSPMWSTIILGGGSLILKFIKVATQWTSP